MSALDATRRAVYQGGEGLVLLAERALWLYHAANAVLGEHRHQAPDHLRAVRGGAGQQLRAVFEIPCDLPTPRLLADRAGDELTQQGTVRDRIKCTIWSQITSMWSTPGSGGQCPQRGLP